MQYNPPIKHHMKQPFPDHFPSSIENPMSGGGRKGEEVMNGAGQAGSDAADVESLVESFVGVTSASREEAHFFLESHEWQLNTAIESFFEDQPPGGREANNVEEEGEDDEEEEREGKEVDSDDEDYVPSENEDAGNTSVARPSMSVRVSGSGSRGKEKSEKPSRRSAITTFSDLKRKAESESDSDDTDSDEDQDYYAGGEKR
jgi:UBX domain-containing protein 1